MHMYNTNRISSNTCLIFILTLKPHNPSNDKLVYPICTISGALKQRYSIIPEESNCLNAIPQPKCYTCPGMDCYFKIPEIEEFKHEKNNNTGKMKN